MKATYCDFSVGRKAYIFYDSMSNHADAETFMNEHINYEFKNDNKQ